MFGVCSHRCIVVVRFWVAGRRVTVETPGLIWVRAGRLLRAFDPGGAFAVTRSG